MKISQIIQETSTTAGSVAPTEHGFVKMQTRNPSVYGGNKVGNLLKGKKTSKPFANSLNEAAMKDLVYDLQNMKPAEFFKKYGKSREEMKASMSKQPQKPTPPVNETDLSEQDLIVVPGQGRSVKTGFVPHDKDRTDHEVEMAVSDLFSAGKNAEKIYNIVRSVSEDEGLEGWVQEKIIKANDYLNTVREYLEGKQLQGMNESTEDYEEIFYLNNKQGKVGAVVQYKDKTFGFIYGTKLSPTKFTRAREAQQALSDHHNKQGTTESLGTTGAMTNGEMGESQLDELSPKALGSYVKSASGDMANRKGDTQFQKGARVATSAFNSKLPVSRFEKDTKIEKRQAGIDRAVDKITSKK